MPRAPKIIWLTCGNTSDAALRKNLTANFQGALRRLDAGVELDEIAKEEMLDNVVEKIYWLALRRAPKK